MANIFIIHGSEGSPNENWIPWLKDELEKIGHKVLVPAFPTPEKQTLDEWMKTFARDFDFVKIRENCKKFVIYHSENDPYVKLTVAQELAEKLGVSVTLVKGAGHFNSAAGYNKFELLLEDLSMI